MTICPWCKCETPVYLGVRLQVLDEHGLDDAKDIEGNHYCCIRADAAAIKAERAAMSPEERDRIDAIAVRIIDEILSEGREK